MPPAIRRRPIRVRSTRLEALRLHDISDGGARLNFFIPLMRLPRTFTLLFFQDSSPKRDCEVMWTAGSFAGVRFMSPWYSASKGGPRADRAPLLAEENGSYA